MVITYWANLQPADTGVIIQLLSIINVPVLFFCLEGWNRSHYLWHQPKLHALFKEKSLQITSNIYIKFHYPQNEFHLMTPVENMLGKIY